MTIPSKTYWCLCVCLLLASAATSQSTNDAPDTSPALTDAAETSPSLDSTNPETSLEPKSEPTVPAEEPSPESEPTAEGEPVAEPTAEGEPVAEPSAEPETTPEDEPATKEEPSPAGDINPKGRSAQGTGPDLLATVDNQTDSDALESSVDPTGAIDVTVQKIDNTLDELEKGNRPGTQHRKGDKNSSSSFAPIYTHLSLIVILMWKLF